MFKKPSGSGSVFILPYFFTVLLSYAGFRVTSNIRRIEDDITIVTLLLFGLRRLDFQVGGLQTLVAGNVYCTFYSGVKYTQCTQSPHLTLSLTASDSSPAHHNIYSVSTQYLYTLPQDPPLDRWNLLYLTLVLHGVGTLMPWNIFINAKTVSYVSRI